MADNLLSKGGRTSGRLSSCARWTALAAADARTNASDPAGTDRTAPDSGLPLIMGIVNVTPDSFHDGGHHGTVAAAIAHARKLIEQGADIIDIGGESTRPGARAVSEAEELDRVVPVVEAIAARSGDGAADICVSVDTSRPAVMRAVVAAGAGFINDVRALTGHPDAMATAAALKVPVCIMHMRGQPRTMQDAPAYADVVAEVHAWLQERAVACEVAGIERDRIFVDPGIGFGKLLAHNLALLKALPALVRDGRGVLVGASRKSMLGEIIDQPSERRLYASLTVAVHAASSGASVLRVHDVEATVESLRTWAALRDAGERR